MSKRFPTDCKGCPHYTTFDMSIDDWTNICDVLNIQMDDCDIDFLCHPKCPLEMNEPKEGYYGRLDKR